MKLTSQNMTTMINTVMLISVPDTNGNDFDDEDNRH
jgi:hypothetical protein